MKFVQWHLGIVWVALALLLTFSALALAGGDDSDPNSPDQKDPGREESLLGTDSIGPKRGAGNQARAVIVKGPDDWGPPNSSGFFRLKPRLFGPDETGPQSHED